MREGLLIYPEDIANYIYTNNPKKSRLMKIAKISASRGYKSILDWYFMFDHYSEFIETRELIALLKLANFNFNRVNSILANKRDYNFKRLIEVANKLRLANKLINGR